MMKNFKLLILVIIVSVFATESYSQETSAGKNFYVDYLKWNVLKPSMYINCGNDDMLNTGDKLTMEVWIRAHISTLNQKIVGKMFSEANNYDNGYVMGVELSSVYSEIFNPSKNETYRPATGGPMPFDSAWVHIATTFSSTGYLKAYINGIETDALPIFTENPITPNDRPLIIGLAPWDEYSWEYTGNIEEVRIWNTERSAQEINDYMYKELNGDEEGLVAYYNFNDAVDSLVTDNSINENNGVVKNPEFDCWEWATSYAPVGNDIMYEMKDVTAAWFGKDINPLLTNLAVTDNGMSMIADINEKDFERYVVFGHNDSTGISVEDLPEEAPEDFKRLNRVWYVNQGNNIVAKQLFFNLEDAANGGEILPVGEADSLYTLLERDGDFGDFYPVFSASEVSGNSIYFNYVPLSDKYYTIGYGSKKLAEEAISVKEIDNPLDKVIVYPNPSKGDFIIQNAQNSSINIFNVLGDKVLSSEIKSDLKNIDIKNFSGGIYIISIEKDGFIDTKKIIIEK